MSGLDRYLQEERERINRALDRFLPAAAHPPAIYEAMRYSVAAGGKRLRPLLTLAVARTLGADAEAALPFACAVELIHTYSLVHDDLPAMDDSDLRRGKPSCHRVFGEAVAILAGDALLTLAFELVCRGGLEQGRGKEALAIGAELAAAGGAGGMIGGQVLDLEAEGSFPDVEELERINRLKTGALIRAAVRCGAIVAGAGPRELEALSGYGSRLGLAFQIVDDLLDREGDAAELGKQPGADQARAKSTYPALLGAAEARRRVEKLYQEALAFLDQLGRPAETLRDLARRLVYRKS